MYAPGLRRSTPATVSCVVSRSGGRIVRYSTVSCVACTARIASSRVSVENFSNCARIATCTGHSKQTGNIGCASTPRLVSM